MRHGSLFSGIGGFDLAAEWMGWENVFHCEWNEFGQKVLKHYWPNAESFNDITKSDFTKYHGTIDIISGGFPCQPFSTAGQRKGTEDERYLWGEMLRAIHEVKPKYIVAENVVGITNIDGGLVFNQVCLDLENEGYEVQPFIIGAASKDAPHKRERVWFIAYADNERNSTKFGEIQKKNGKISQWNDNAEFSHTNAQHNINGIIINRDATDTTSTRREQNNGERTSRFNYQKNTPNDWDNFPTEPPICGGDDGLPSELDGITFPKWRNESIKAYGNAIVPQVAYEIFKAIEATNKDLD